MQNYARLNNLIGWLVFAIATFTYVSTIEPTASFWDCGEYIACAFKLEVGHPPGAPFFLLVARFFSLFAFGDVLQAAKWINIMSALSSSFTILFLFWTITRLAKKMIFKSNASDATLGEKLVVLGSGIIGALAYTFSDSFWFSAVEGEVYAMSSLFTAMVFWAILKWEEEADEPDSMRWIVLIAYLMGLSVGVHLLNLLVIPAICFIYYYKKYNFSWKGWFITGIVSVVLLGGIQGGIIPGIVKLAADYELFFVNTVGTPFNYGTILYFLLLFTFIGSAIHYSLKNAKLSFNLMLGSASLFALLAIVSAGSAKSVAMRILIIGSLLYGIYYLRNSRALLNTIMISFFVLMIGYSSFFVLVIRSQANTPMDENDPENAITLLSYLNREQYGDWPLSKGQYYNSPLDKQKPYLDGNPVYAKDEKSGKYVVTDDRTESIPNYDPEFCTVFPRMWDSGHESSYVSWGNVKGRRKTVVGNDGEPQEIMMPTFSENLYYFFNYQIRYMYWRYFLWNFAGRQNDVQGLNDNSLEGNWISGFKGFDESHYGAKFDNLPSNLTNNKATNKFYFLPLILGLIGLVFQINRGSKDAFVVFCLFFFTGLAIVIYLNQYPYQPRERDYAYAASFYAYGIWIGLGVLAIFDFLRKKLNGELAAASATLVSLAVPGIMAAEGWDDHDRSKRTMSRDFAVNYLNSCAPNAILFTNGDNDTFPLWYAQEVEGIRTDVRVVNLSLLQTDWYINQMRRAAYESAPIPMTLSPEKYVQGTRDIVYFMDKNVGYVNIKELMEFVASENPETKLNAGRKKLIEFFPTNKIRVDVDSAKVVKNGTIPKGMEGRIQKYMDWEINRQYVLKNDLIIMDLLAANNWERPIYFAVTTGSDAYLNLDSYLQLEGLAYRVVPIKSNPGESAQGIRVNTSTMYDNIMNKFKWGGMKTKGVYMDENCLRMAANMRIQMSVLAGALVEEGKKDLAIKVLDKAFEEMPETNIPLDATVYSLCVGYYQAGDAKKGNAIAQKLFDTFEKDLQYYNKLSYQKQASFGPEIRRMREVLTRLVSATTAFKQTELSKKFEDRVMNVISSEDLNEMYSPQNR